jgi:predicted transcriptional regulator
MENEDLIGLTAAVVANYVANNRVATNDVAGVVQQVYVALAGLGEAQEELTQAKSPVVSVRASVKPDYIVCMECGTKHKMLKRHVMSAHKMTPVQYRADYGLPDSYPMVAPNYSEQRRSLAKSIGLGRRRAAPADAAPEAETGEAPPKKAARRGRPKKEAAASE